MKTIKFDTPICSVNLKTYLKEDDNINFLNNCLNLFKKSLKNMQKT